MSEGLEAGGEELRGVHLVERPESVNVRLEWQGNAYICRRVGTEVEEELKECKADNEAYVAKFGEVTSQDTNCETSQFKCK